MGHLRHKAWDRLGQREPAQAENTEMGQKTGKLPLVVCVVTPESLGW